MVRNLSVVSAGSGMVAPLPPSIPLLQDSSALNVDISDFANNPGTLVVFVADNRGRCGQSRSSRLSVSLPKMRQTLYIEPKNMSEFVHYCELGQLKVVDVVRL